MKSPNYPLNYSVDQDITFPLMVAEGKAIELTFTSMEIEECHDPMFGPCFCDYVEVLDSDESRLLKECNNEVPSPITSTGNTMWVIFHSDYSVNMKGFSADWKSVDPPPTITTGEETSPNYPENYPDNLNRKSYVIKVAIGKKVELTIEDLSIEECEDCSCDMLEIYDTPTTGSPTLLDVSMNFSSNFYQLLKNILDFVWSNPSKQLVHKHKQHHDPLSVDGLQRQRQGFQGIMEGSQLNTKQRPGCD